MTATRTLWAILAAVFLLFLGWYDYSGGPLTPAEIDFYESLLLERGLEGTRVPEAMRAFAEADDGGEFFMVNLENYREEPLLPEGFPSDADPYQVERDYSVPTALMLLRRACHPISAFRGELNFIDYEWAPTWERLLLVRYRSRRDFLEIFSSEQTTDAIRFKFVFMEQGHSWPTDTEFNFAGIRGHALVSVLLIGLVGQWWIGRRARAAA